MSFSFHIARRYLRSRTDSRFLSRVSLTAMTGIVLGVMVLDLTLAIMNGFHEEMQDTFVDNMPMVTVVTSDPIGFGDVGAVVDSIGAVDGVIGAAPFIRQEVILTVSGAFGVPRHRAAVTWGIDPVLQEDVTPFGDRLLPGRVALERLQSPDPVPRMILGVELATSLIAGPGDTIVVTAPRGELELDRMEAESRKFVVAGFLDTGMYEFDSRFAYLSLDAARDFYGFDGQGASGIGVKVDDMMAAPDIAGAIEDKLGPASFHATDWIALNRNLFQWIRIEKVVMFLLLAMVVLVAAFNIVGILRMMVGERGREIGIMLGMGARKTQIQSIFVMDGFWLGFCGTVVGSLMGWLGTVFLQRVGFPIPGDVYFLDHVPVVAEWGDFLLVAAAALVISLLAAIEPSHEAARLEPVEIIRYT